MPTFFERGGAQKMNKKTIIYICLAVVVVISIAIALYFIIANNSNNTDKVEKIVLEKYENYELAKTLEITDKKKLKELTTIYEGVSLEQDENTESLAIRSDVKLDLGNGTIFFIQLDIPDYCYMENSNTNVKTVIKMPVGLLEYVNTVLNENK